ncbi:hypothetical protein HAX54_022488 [Datura stramonium]|uniref:Uncharacterized protein n=1 Tax=Datura stramonium TaxID=4076 RepID=A0ABS8UUC8_DATST|nr:hypothetical protein [Datura stramonium]
MVSVGSWIKKGHDIEEEEADYGPDYDPRGVDVTKTKELEGINGPLRMNGVTEEHLQQLNIDYPLSEHSQAFCRVGPGYEDPLDDDVAMEDEMEIVDSDI